MHFETEFEPKGLIKSRQTIELGGFAPLKEERNGLGKNAD